MENRIRRRPLRERYSAFCADAQELLQEAGLEEPTGTPRIPGHIFWNACVNLASLHFPEDKEVNGTGPRGILWAMHRCVNSGAPVPKGERYVEGAIAIARTLRHIIKHRPALDKESRGALSERREVLGRKCPFYEPKRKYNAQPNLVFVLMPFHEPWSDRLWNDHIRKYLSQQAIGIPLEIRRADEMYGQTVMEDVWEGLLTARIILADCTGRNPNVMYELGLAHAIGKRTVLLSQAEPDIPFDLKRFRFGIYEDNSSGYPKLRRFLHETVLGVVRK